jgi:hypothetical protein
MAAVRFGLCLGLLLAGCSLLGNLDDLSGEPSSEAAGADGGESREGSAGTAGMGGTAGGGSGAAGTPGSSGSAGDPGADAGPCGAQRLCVPPAPLGWKGPVGLFLQEAPAEAPDCAALDLREELTGFADPLYLPLDCEPCTCAGPGPEQCHFSVTAYSGGCGSLRLATLALNGDGTCLSAPVPFPTTASLQLEAVNYVAVACIPAGGAAEPTGPIGGSVARACSGLETGVPCGGGNLCIHSPPAPLGNAACVYRTGELECPADYAVRTLVTTVDDRRSCSRCACSPGAASCRGIVELHGREGCSDPRGVLTGPGDCETLSVSQRVSARAAGVRLENACTPSGGAPIGEVTQVESITICCLP